jgi:hypothetical protein
MGGSNGIDRGDAMNFLSSVGQDPEAYKAITAAQTGYTQGLVDVTMAQGSQEGLNFDRVQDRVINATSPGSSIAGIMSEARAEAVYEQRTADAKDFNTTVDEVNKWVGRGLSVGTTFMASPAAGAGVSVGYGAVSDFVVEHIKQDYTAEGDFDAVDTYASGAQSHERTINSMVRESAAEHGYDAGQADDMGANVARECHQTFGVGASGTRERG